MLNETFFCNFQTLWRPWLKSNFEAWCKTSLFSKTTSADSVEKLVNYHIKATHPQGPNSSYQVVLPERLILLEYTTFDKNHVRYLLLPEVICWSHWIWSGKVPKLSWETVQRHLSFFSFVSKGVNLQTIPFEKRRKKVWDRKWSCIFHQSFVYFALRHVSSAICVSATWAATPASSCHSHYTLAAWL